MKYEIRGASKETGEDVTIVIEADNLASAERRAGRRGVIIESIVQINDSGDSVAGDTSLIDAIRQEAGRPPPIPKTESRSVMAARMTGAPPPLIAGLCPSCGSNDAKRAEIIYMEGTSTKSFSGLSINGEGQLGGFGGSGRSVSGLARRLAPPARRSRAGIILIILGILIALISIAMMADKNSRSATDGLPGLLIGTGMAIGGFFADKGPREFNEKEHPARMAQWRRTWCCLRCGMTFLK